MHLRAYLKCLRWIKECSGTSLSEGESVTTSLLERVILDKLQNDDQPTLCGGALISNAFALTAAHCVLNATTITIGMGSIVLAQPLVSMIAQSKIIHPNYNSLTYANDLALLRLPLNLTSSASIQWIRLPTISQTTNQFVNATGILSGFGRVTDQNWISKSY
ncbi:hypothetical protein HA402_003142 [Bradysia odoriphaga]|nr:hypothetical protein HA402_003142 [Bradysia odoriphaga]